MIEVKHEVNQCFYIQPHEERAVLDYSREGIVMNIQHVYVPPSLRGQGIAESLTREALEYAKLQGYSIIPSCPYVSQTFLRRYPEYQSLCVNF